MTLDAQTSVMAVESHITLGRSSYLGFRPDETNMEGGPHTLPSNIYKSRAHIIIIISPLSKQKKVLYRVHDSRVMCL